MISNNYRIPGSRANGGDNARGGKGSRRKRRQSASNLANGGDRPGEDDNFQPQEEFASREGGNYQDIRGGPAADVLYTGEDVEAPSDLDWGELGNYGTDSDVGIS